MKTTDQDQATDNAQTADQVPLDWWLVPALFMAGKYADVMARINGWGDDRQREYMSELARDIRADVASGDLPTRSARTRRRNKPGPDAYEGGLLDLQDFCDWAARTGLQGCPKSAEVLARALDLPLSARAMAITPAMDAHLVKISAPSAPSAPSAAHPAPVAHPAEVVPQVIRAMKTPEANQINALRALKEAKGPDGSPMFDLLAIPRLEGRTSPAKQYLMERLRLTPDAAKLALSALKRDREIKYADPVKTTR